MFQKKAIGKFLISVPIQTAGSFVTGIPSIMILYRIEATRLIAGHMTAIVPAWRRRRQMYGLSFSGSQCFAAKAAPARCQIDALSDGDIINFHAVCHGIGHDDSENDSLCSVFWHFRCSFQLEFKTRLRVFLHLTKKRVAFNWIYAVECHTSNIILYDSHSGIKGNFAQS